MMFILRTSLNNAFRHRIRTSLTILGLTVAVLAFGLLQTVITAWYSKATSASTARLVTRNATSLIFDLPIHYREQISGIQGIEKVAYAQWFGGIYKDPKNFFPQFAVSNNYLEVFTDFILPGDNQLSWIKERRGAIVGKQLAERFNFKLGDKIPLKGTLYPGNWDFIVSGVYEGSDETKVTDRMFFHWDYLNSHLSGLPVNPTLKPNTVGVFISTIDDPTNAAKISNMVDRTFKNSNAPTFTETEQAFQLGFVAMSDQIIEAIRTVSYVIVLIILAVMANTMAMSVRERTREFATMKALGFKPKFLTGLILSESLLIAGIGGCIGVILTPPSAKLFQLATDSIFPVFLVSNKTVILQILSSAAVGILAGIVPAINIHRIKVIDGLRAIS